MTQCEDGIPHDRGLLNRPVKLQLGYDPTSLSFSLPYIQKRRQSTPGLLSSTKTAQAYRLNLSGGNEMGAGRGGGGGVEAMNVLEVTVLQCREDKFHVKLQNLLTHWDSFLIKDQWHAHSSRQSKEVQLQSTVYIYIYTYTYIPVHVHGLCILTEKQASETTRLYITCLLS